MGGRGARSGFEALGIIAREPSEIREIKSANEAKNFDELQRYMLDTHGVELTPAVEQLDFKTIRSNLQSFEDVLKAFPRARGFLEPIIQIEVSEESSGYFAAIKPNGDVLVSPLFRDVKRLNKAYSRMIRDGRTPVGVSTADILRHEAGHLLARAIVEKYAQGLNPIAKARVVSKEWRDGTREEKILDRAYRLLQSTQAGKGKTRQQLAGEVSKNATENASETFADCIVDYSKNGENAKELSKLVWGITKRILG